MPDDNFAFAASPSVDRESPADEENGERLHALGGLFTPRPFKPLGEEFAATKLGESARKASAMARGLQYAVRAANIEQSLPRGYGIVVIEVEHLLTREVGAMLYLKRGRGVADDKQFDEIARRLERVCSELLQAVLLARGVSPKQLSLGLDGHADTAVSSTFVKNFEEHFAGEANVSYYDAATNRHLMKIHLDAVGSEAGLSHAGPTSLYVGVVKSLLDEKRIIFTLEDNGGDIEAEIVPELHSCRLVLLWLSKSLCALELIATMVPKSKRQPRGKIKYALSDVCHILNGDSQGALGMLESAGRALAEKSLRANQWNEVVVSRSDHKSASTARSLLLSHPAESGGREEQTVPGLRAAHGAAVPLQDCDAEASPPKMTAASRRRKKRQLVNPDDFEP